MNRIRWSFLIVLAGLVSACGSTDPMQAGVAPPGARDSTPRAIAACDAKPWICVPPEPTQTHMFFVGTSLPAKAMQTARNNGLEDAVTQAITYIGVYVKDEMKSANVSFGLASAGLDPTVAEERFNDRLRAGLVRTMRTKEAYIEQSNADTGLMYLVYINGEITIAAMNQSMQHAAQDQQSLLEDAARKRLNDRAKQQVQDALDFWKKLKERELPPPR